jgi:bifunctional non-homologous end joining protein LigD
LTAKSEARNSKSEGSPKHPTFARIEGVGLALSNLGKELYPSHGFTKAQVLDYYRRISPFILPHLQDRALTLKRYPDGAEGPFFFEKRCPPARPGWVPTASIPLSGGKSITACLVNDLRTLMWVENLASIELHVPLARAGSPHSPDAVVFDLDPGEGAGMADCCRVALIIRELVSRMRVSCWVKTSGMKGLHVMVPLNRKGMTFERTRDFSKAVALLVQRDNPELVTTLLAKPARRKKVFINWAQNSSTKTMVAVYSLRARESPVVSFPIAWPEVESAAAGRGRARLLVIASEALRRVDKEGDLFAEVLTRRQVLPRL